jgi:hypothetical protein
MQITPKQWIDKNGQLRGDYTPLLNAAMAAGMPPKIMRSLDQDYDLSTLKGQYQAIQDWAFQWGDSPEMQGGKAFIELLGEDRIAKILMEDESWNQGFTDNLGQPVKGSPAEGRPYFKQYTGKYESTGLTDATKLKGYALKGKTVYATDMKNPGPQTNVYNFPNGFRGTNAEYTAKFGEDGNSILRIDSPEAIRLAQAGVEGVATTALYEEWASKPGNAPQAAVSPSVMGGGKLMNWELKQQALKRVEELRSQAVAGTLSYAVQQEFDAIQRNLYASILINKDNPNPPEANATSITDNAAGTTPQFGTQTGVVPTPTTTLKPTATATPTTNFVATDGTKFTTQDAFTTYQSNLNQKAADTRSAIQIVTDRFNKYGLGSLAAKIQELAVLGATEATITLGLQDTPEYQARFSANQNRLKQGLTVLSPAEYLSVEDGYRQVLRAYGLKQFDTDAYVQQFISNDTSPTEFSNRVVTAVQRIQNADPAIIKQLRDYYGIGSADMVAYVLDPQQQFEKIKLQVAASEIGVMAGRQGLTAGVGVAEQLAKQGVTQAEAQKGYSTIADILPTAEKLSGIYGQTTGTTYGQSEAEQEVFNSLASAQRARQRLSSLEVAQFSGQSGLSKTALSTQNKGNF